MISENVFAKGALNITVLDAQGNVKDEINVKNLVVSTGKSYIAGMLGTTPPTALNNMAVGTGTTSPLASDTTLQQEIGTRATLTVAQTAGTPTITYTATFGPGNATGAITEAGLFNASTAGTLVCRTTFAPVNKGSSDTIAITWSVTIQ